MNIQNSTGCFLNEEIKTAVLIKDGSLVSSFCYAKKQISHELLLLNIQQDDSWEQTTEYVYVTPDNNKGWNQPFSGLKNKMAIEFLPAAWKQRVVTIESYLNA